MKTEVCKTHRRVFNRESNPRPFSVSGKCIELNGSRMPPVLPRKAMGIETPNSTGHPYLFCCIVLRGASC